ncbi:MAG: RNA polymerase sigma-70 factor [Cytophagales bacterium]|nr:RNA polymerase sigma-70 factor [Cytophagales bacterium]
MTEIFTKTELNEKQLLRLEDTEFFKAVYFKYANALFQYSFQYTLDKAQAEDVVQEVFLDLWKNRKKIKIKTTLQAYLYSMVKYKNLNSLRRQQTLPHIPLDEINSPVQAETTDTEDAFRTEKLIQQKIDELPAQTRETFRLSRFDGLTYQEIATIQGISIKTVETQISRSLKKLRKELNYLLKST